MVAVRLSTLKILYYRIEPCGRDHREGRRGPPEKGLVVKTATLALLAVLFCAALVQAQTETGQITGTVFDQSGGVIPNATVTLVDPSTKATRTNMTSRGVYVFPSLPTGRYEVSTTASGFQTTKQVVTVTVGSKIGLDFHLQVGTQSQVVEVQEQIARVNTETQTLGANITGSEIADLPTITRDPYDLVKTVGNTTDGDPGGASRGVGVSINGLRASDVAILLDGVPNLNNFNTQVAIKTPLDSVGEFSVLTSNFTAEFGRAIAGVVNVDTKRGTNAFHGTAYEFNRVAALTSNTFDNNAKGIAKSLFTRNQFGFSAGGALKKDKLFFFGNPEWIRVRSVLNQSAVIATPQLIAATAPNTQQFFSTFGNLKSNLIPVTTFTRAQVCTTGPCTAIPAGTPIYQEVTYGIAGDAGGGTPQNTLNFAGRVDYNLSEKTLMYFRYARYDESDFSGSLASSPYVGYDQGQTFFNIGYALSVTHIFSPTLVTQTKLSYNRITNRQPLSTQPISPTLYTQNGATGSLGSVDIVYPGYAAFTPSAGGEFGGPQNYIQLNQDATKFLGKHNFRFGGSVTYLQDDRVFGAYETAVADLGTNKSSALNGLITGHLHDFQAAVYPQGKFPCHFADPGGSANIVVTPDCTLTLPVGPPDLSRSNRYHDAALYVQDSWKLRPRLTVNLGLRWEYFGPQANGNPNKDSNFYFGSGSNIETQTQNGKVLISTDPNNPIGGLWNKKYNLFAPRVGLAYDLFGDGKTALRGGYGLGWEPNFGNITFNVIQNPPNYSVLGLTAPADVPVIPITTDNAGPLAGSGGTKALPRVTLRAVDPHIQMAYAHLWSASLEHQFENDVLAAIEYTGSKGEDLYSIYRLNINGSRLVYGGTGSPSATTRMNDQYGLINFRSNGGFSHYNALNARVEVRNFARKALTLRANYTYSHAIDNLSNTFSETVTGSGNLGFLDPLNPGLDKGSSDFDVRHRFLLAAIYQVPYQGKNAVTKAALGGWSVIANFTARTGTPFSLWDCTNAAYALCPRAMYDSPFKATYTAAPSGNPNEFKYLNVGSPDSSYVNPVAGVADFGPFPGTMTGRNVFVEPGYWNVDFSIHKNFAIGERFTLQLRGEAYNVFNHSNLYLVGANTDVSGTSVVTAIRGIRADNTSFSGPDYSPDNRNLQLALKLIF